MAESSKPFPRESAEVREAYEHIDRAVREIKVVAGLQLPRGPAFGDFFTKQQPRAGTHETEFDHD